MGARLIMTGFTRRWQNGLLAFFRSQWINLTLLGAVAGVMAASFREAAWMRYPEPILDQFLLAVLFGAMLAVSRFRGWFAFVFVLVMGGAFSVQAVGRIVPEMLIVFSQNLNDLATGMNIRLWAFFGRVSGWLERLAAGQEVTDRGMVGLLAALLAWFVLVWLCWCVIRRRQALAGLAPAGILLTINAIWGETGLGLYMLFFGLAALMIARTAFTGMRGAWTARGVDYPDELGEWPVSALAITLLLVLAARLFALLASPEGWQQLEDMLTPEEAPVVQHAPLPTLAAVDAAVNIETPAMLEIGAPIPNNFKTVMYVELSDPPPPPREAGGLPGRPPRQYYFRSSLLAVYTGRGWETPALETQARNAPFDEDLPPIGEVVQAELPVGRYVLRQQFEIVAQHGGTLFSVADPVWSPPAAQPLISAGGGVVLNGRVNEYNVISYATDVTANQLRAASDHYPDEVSEEYLQLPESLPQRVRTLAGRIAADHDTAYDKAIVIQDYLRSTYPYALEVGAPPAGRDVVDYFLFEGQQGFCSYFASAMTVMLRTQGIPARVATGYALGEYDYARGAYRIPASAAHAWVEVYFSGIGWVEFEPTPALSAVHYTDIQEEEAGEQELKGKVPAFTISRNAGILIGVIVALGLIIGVLRLGMLVNAGLRGQRLPSDPARRLYWRVRLSLSPRGADESMTPLEFLAVSSQGLSEYPRLLKVLESATHMYVRAVFAEKSPALAEVGALTAAWRRCLPERLRWATRTALDQRRARQKQPKKVSAPAR